ncbi:unnamed protein product [Mycena citricolor]|uniref:BHLH domain-containing protein n=1 Tax=Mycena citricolor TaxID=2018698 RepID=A0AAD2Q2X6_9AGAR|nr:unnamed protein product [Mycena citricolor]
MSLESPVQPGSPPLPKADALTRSEESSLRADSLLSNSETSTFHAFLDKMDYEHGFVGREWAMYAQTQQEEQYHDRNALAKATKDLMALDAPNFAEGHSQQSHYYQPPPQAPQYAHSPHLEYGPSGHGLGGHQRQPVFPFLQQQQQHSQNRMSHQPHPLNMSLGHHPHAHPSQHTPYTATPSSTSASTSAASYSFPPSPCHPSPKITSNPSTAHLSAHAHAHHAGPGSDPGAPSVGAKQQQQQQQPRARAPAPAAKPTLLSPSQKKANHIQSEQKRRANIRRGYESLCEVVPALRDAIREEEMLVGSGAAGGAKGRRKRGGKADEADKLDGRAGPRSENVVLSKTIDHLEALLAERTALVSRLERARLALPPGHPALVPTPGALTDVNGVPTPLWEREWKGGAPENDGDEEEDEEVDDDS